MRHCRASVLQAAVLDFDGVSGLLTNIELTSRAFQTTCADIKRRLHPHKCMARTAAPPHMLRYLLGVAVVFGVLALILALLPRFSPKPKVN